jgi:molybdopterin synthase catalytic subunit/molybdopterin converting factor small subunit
MVTLKFYAALRQVAGLDDIRLGLKQPCPVRTLVQSLQDMHPELATLLDQGKILVSVNEEMAQPDTVVKDGDEIAFMPPFSGGGMPATRLPGRLAEESLPMARIQEADFSLDAEVARVKQKSKRVGAVAVFLGTAREFSKGHEVLSISLEQYAGMAGKKVRELRETALKQFPIFEVSIVHRIGELSIGDNIVLIVVGAEHRAQAFEACRWCIDELKRTVPLWKKEKTPSGEIWVEDRP